MLYPELYPNSSLNLKLVSGNTWANRKIHWFWPPCLIFDIPLLVTVKTSNPSFVPSLSVSESTSYHVGTSIFLWQILDTLQEEKKISF